MIIRLSSDSTNSLHDQFVLSLMVPDHSAPKEMPLFPTQIRRSRVRFGVCVTYSYKYDAHKKDAFCQGIRVEHIQILTVYYRHPSTTLHLYF